MDKNKRPATTFSSSKITINSPPRVDKFPRVKGGTASGGGSLTSRTPGTNISSEPGPSCMLPPKSTSLTALSPIQGGKEKKPPVLTSSKSPKKIKSIPKKKETSETARKLQNLYRPTSNIEEYDNELYTNNPLLIFKLLNVKQRRHYTFLKQKGAEDKIKICRTPLTEMATIQFPIEKEYFLSKMRSFAHKIPVPKMMYQAEQKILSYIPKKFHDKYPDVIKLYMSDVFDEYNKRMRAFSVRTILSKPVESDDDPDKEYYEPCKIEIGYKNAGKTPRYHVFLQNREKLKRILLITQPFIRAILHYSYTDFPESLNDFSQYNKGGAPDEIGAQYLANFVKLAQNDLKNNSTFLKWSWYPKIVTILKKHFRKRTVDHHLWPKVFSCAKGLINRQLNILKIRTFEHLIQVILNPERIPRFKINLECDSDDIILNPSLDMIESAFCDIIDDIVFVGTQMEALETQINIYQYQEGTDEFLKITMNNVFLTEIINSIKTAIQKTYNPLRKYLDHYRKKYYELYSKEMRDDLEDFLSKPREFNEYFNKINSYTNHVDQLRLEPARDFFQFALINNEPAIKRLRQMTNDLTQRVIKQIIFEHMREEQEICNKFEEIRDRAIKIPVTTEELLEAGEYMTNVKTKEFFVLQDRIQECLHIGSELMSLTELTPEHISLQIRTISWIKEIGAVFEQNASFHEYYKGIFEDHLQDVTKKLNDDLQEMIPSMAILNDMHETEKFLDYRILLRNYVDQLKIYDEYVTWINKEEKLFKIQQSTYPILDTLKSFVYPFADLMDLCVKWLRHYYVWMDGPFEYLEPKFVEETVDYYFKEFQKHQKFFRTKIKQDLVGDSVCKFKGQIEDPDPEKIPVPLRLCQRMLNWLRDFSTGALIVKIMCNPALRDRHWVEMSSIVGFDITPDAGTTLRKIINYQLDTKLELCEIVSIGAEKELQLQENLVAMIHEWDEVELPSSTFKNTKIPMLSSMDVVQALLDDHYLKTLTMRGSAFMKPSEDEVLAWYDKLTRVIKTLELWTKVQANYLYMMPIFSSKDITSQMPDEARLFTQVEIIYKRAMEMIIRQPLVMETVPATGLLESFERAVEFIEDITAGVNAYLEKKRLYFPRFFFLSNDEMLEILSETKDPLRVQPHLYKCFEGIDRLGFDSEKNVLSMLSGDDEEVTLVNKISTKAAGACVEKWLLGVEGEMVGAVAEQTKKSYYSYAENKRDVWVTLWPQMIVLCISQVYWAVNTHKNLELKQPGAMPNFFKTLNTDLNDIVALIRSAQVSNLNRIAIKSLIVIDVHAKDVIESLIKNKISSSDDFQWVAQLRYYYEDEKALVRIINATIPYANEYLGNSDRLVITPLTDRCYRTLIGAYQLHLNGAPEGPAGTGKTETTKDLAKALAVQCKVFNCSEGLDYIAMGKFFKGFAACGAWSCFDEFNRIELEVLSVIAQQILCIIQAIRAGQQRFIFEGTELDLNPACYICITMNPGYAGRTELPDNLKVLFRPVAMMVPDYAMIGEISLYSYGFLDARTLAVKIVTTYRLCSEQLSSQNHYDYGMRAVKSVLIACGNLKKAHPAEDEGILLLRSLLDVNLPKFLSFDIPLFEGIVSDLFPGTEMPNVDYGLMETAFKDATKEMNLQPHPKFFVKIVQTFEMMIVRHGFMMVGLPMAGKTSTLKVLAKILSQLKGTKASPFYQDVQMGVLNPKSVTLGQLYGEFDPLSYEWCDGIASTIFRSFAMDPSPDRKWLIFDGPIDAVWIESMNTVLDDNKKLCLTSGEVITMSNSMSMIFEVMDLAQASPATVSRCGMIYMEPGTLGWETFAKSWLNTCDRAWGTVENKNYVFTLLNWLIPITTVFVRRECTQLLKSGEYNLVKTTFTLFEMYMAEALHETPEEYEKYLMSWIQASMIMSIIWGIGGILNESSREKFDVLMRQLWDEENQDSLTYLGRLEVNIPSEGFLCEYRYLYKQKGIFRYWPDLVKKMEPDVTPLGLQVATVDTGRYLHLLNLHIKYKKKLLFVGPTGTGKTFYMQNTLMTKLGPEFTPAFITFTVKMSANQTQELILSKLVRRSKRKYSAPKGTTSIIFVDDMNMPAKEIYGAQPPLEVLRQYFDHGHLYDLKDTAKLYIEDILILCACGIPGGSRQDVYQRFLNHFCIFSINSFSEETMQKIFSTVLVNGLKKVGHGLDVLPFVQSIISSTLHLFKEVCGFLRPTPSKSHYIYNLRDVSRVCTGCALLRKESVDNKKVFAKLWYHEAMRVFYDRLVDSTDQNWMFEVLNGCVTEFFKAKLEVIFENYLNEDGEFTLEAINSILFGNYLDEDAMPEEKKYEEVPSIDALLKIALENLDMYNSSRRYKMDIVLFAYALNHLNRVCRILSIQSGNGLLIGIGGSGRQSLTKLAAQICDEFLFQPEITKLYGVNEWRNDLKTILKESGGLGKDSVFLMNESQFKMELFLQDIDCLLNTGEVPNIYEIDEKQEILEMVRLAAQGGNRNIDISPLQVFSFFINRCKQKLHIILCFSPIGSGLRTRIRLYPSLVNCCTIDWFQIWPKEALQMVAERLLSNIEVPEEVKMPVIIACQYFHSTANEMIVDFQENTGRVVYITPALFLELIRLYGSLLKKKQKEVHDDKMRYVGGLETLQAASKAITNMQQELNELQPKLIQMAENSKRMLIEIEKETIAASRAAEEVKKDEIIANEQAQAAQILKDECEKDLAQAIPVLEDAIQALNTLKPADITLVKSMKNPPTVIKLVMAAVCVIKGIPPDRVADPTSGKMANDYWGPSKRILGDIYFLQSLKDFDKDNINPDIMKKIRKEYIPNKDFNPKVVAKASSAAEGLCKWVIAMDLYDAVAKIVAPKKARLQAAEKEYSDTMMYLAERRELAEALERRVAQLNEDLEKANEEMQRTQDEVEYCKERLERAETLIGGLGEEKERWTIAANFLKKQYDNLPGDILLCSANIAYLSALTAPYRHKSTNEWIIRMRDLNIPCSDEFDLNTVLGNDVKIQNWNLYGLPLDPFSTQNAIMMDSSTRYTLFIDPQGQANKWIKNMERNNQLKVVKFSQSDYMKVIENSIENGRPVLIENIAEELEVPLDPILARNIIKQGKTTLIIIGDIMMNLHENFRLYMTSNLRNPHFSPETFNKVTVINFALTEKGLEDQLLSIVVAKERPDLQELRENLIIEAAKDKLLLKDTENQVLQTLSQSGADILENETAIKFLDDSKKLAADVLAKQETTKETEKVIEAFRLNYKPVATHSSVLYYTVTDLPNIDPMYHFSLNWYINLYMYSIDNANKSKEVEKRRKYLMDAVTYTLYCNVCRSLFEKDKLLYSFTLTTKIMLSSGQITEELLTLLLTGGSGSDTEEMPSLTNPDPSWITDKIWSDILKLRCVDTLKTFPDSVIKYVSAWKKYYNDSDPQNLPLPKPWETKCTRFEKLIILKAFRPDKIFDAVRIFITNELGSQYVTPPPFEISKSYEDSNCLSPLIFLLTPGADPMGSLLLFSEKMRFSETFQSISLGQGQGPIAERLIEEAQSLGSWVCLQNCHLAISWMPRLEAIWEKMDVYNTAATFRLWLTSYPNEKFPIPLLQNGIKVTNEPPTGLKQNLLKSYNSEPMNDDKFYQGCPSKDRAFTRLLYGVCFFHAVIQERRKYGALGWNIQYEFNESDFQISVLQLQMLLNQYDEIVYDALHYLIGECNYGGRVTDAWDRRAIGTILKDYINDEIVTDMQYQFAKGNIYTLPRQTEHREIVRYIDENIPNLPSTEVYGLHENAGIVRNLQASNLLLNSMLLVTGSGGGSVKRSALDTALLHTVESIQSSLPPDFDIEKISEKYPVDYSESMNTVLVQEVERFAKLLIEIRGTCSDLKAALKGLNVMTPQLEEIAAAINLKKIPVRWLQKSYPSLKPLGSYIQDFIERLKWITDWYEHGKPSTFWISGFYFTQAFLTGATQNYARAHRIPIDTLTFDFNVMNQMSLPVAAKQGVYVNGMFMDGARWDKETNSIQEQYPKVLLDQVPAIHLIPTLVSTLEEGGRYKCPLYKTSERKGVLSTTGHSTNYVLAFLLKTKVPHTHWIKRSVALLCQSNN